LTLNLSYFVIEMTESFELTNPVRESPSFKVSHFDDGQQFSESHRYNYFIVIIILRGKGRLMADSSIYDFSDKCLMSFSLYQPFQLTFNGPCEGYLIAFHPDFFCLHLHRAEVSCNGILFNNIYESPLIRLTEDDVFEIFPAVTGLFTEMQRKKQETEILISYLKVMLIGASRIKLSLRESSSDSIRQLPGKLISLQAAIEANFRSIHHASAYAGMLNHSQSALNKSCKETFHKTLSELISDRIILEAKRELYLTSSPVKTIAYNLGFTDEFHFSRYFKRHIGISPQYFRDTVGIGKANAA